jgi:RHH-type rel operon transcriptional repressor/antitoxin RelB
MGLHLVDFKYRENLKVHSWNTTVRLGEDIEVRLEHLAQLTGRTQTYYIRQGVIEKLEDLEDIHMAEQVLENPGKRYTSDEVRQELGLDDCVRTGGT